MESASKRGAEADIVVSNLEVSSVEEEIDF